MPNAAANADDDAVRAMRAASSVLQKWWLDGKQSSIFGMAS